MGDRKEEDWAGSKGGDWLVDGGSNSNISPFSSDFHSLEVASNASPVVLGNGQRLSVMGVGVCRVGLDGGSFLELSNVLHVPDFKQRIISVFMLLCNGYSVHFSPKDLSCVISKNDKIILTCNRSENLWYAGKTSHKCRSNANYAVTADLWHLKFNHLNESDLSALYKYNMVTGMDVAPGGNNFHKNCLGCNCGKQTKLPPAQSSGFISENALELVHTDLLDVTVRSIYGYRYILVLIDDHTRMSWVYFSEKQI